MEEQYLSARAAADYIGKSPRTIRNWIKSGKLTAEKSGRSFRIRREDLAPFRAQEPEESPEVPEERWGLGSASALNAVVSAFETQMEAARDEVRGLREENRNLAGQVGYLQSEVQHLQEEVRLLTAGPVEEMVEEERPRKSWRVRVRDWWRFEVMGEE